MKSLKRIGIFLFFMLVIAAIAIGVKLVKENLNNESYEFLESGYAITLGSKNDISRADVYPFDKNTTYNYKKLNNNISFDGGNGQVTIDNSTVIHYSNNSLLVLKDVVAIDLTKLDSSILMYYNIFKNTTLEQNNGVFLIKAVDGSQIEFKNILMRINENKYLIVGPSIRISIDNVITDLGNYAYIEYTDGNIVQIYNETEYQKVIAKNAKIVTGDISINLDNGVVYEETTAKLTLSNLIINYDGNVDIIPEAAKDLTLPEMKDPKVDLPVSSISQSNLYDEKSGEVAEEKDPVVPVYRVVGLGITPNSINARIEITDDDGLLTSGTHITIIENATYTTVYENDFEYGNQEIPISYTGLNPDTEYTLYAESTYKLDEISYTRNFVTKLFRTESIGINFNKTYATSDSVEFKISKESFSNVDELKIGIYNSRGIEITNKTINFESRLEVEDSFEDLVSNTTYILKMYDVVINGVVEENGYSENISFKTLKKAPTIGEVSYQIDKQAGGFNLNPGTIEDPDYGIVSFRYEVYNALSGQIEDANPDVVVNNDKVGSVFVEIDNNKIQRGTPYTYMLVVEFFDNEKTIEYTKTLDGTMQIDGVQFPSVSWQESFINFEQINGVIIVNDPGHAVVSKNYKIVYYNSINTYKTEKITADSATGHIPINISGLRANETYTFEVYADINLQEANNSEVADETYIGCVYVQTKEPVPLKSSMKEVDNSTKGFEVNFNLDMSTGYLAENKYTCLDKKDCNDDDAIPYEAATLSGLTFSLYQGSSTNGTLVATKKELYTPADEEAQYKSLIAEKVFGKHGLVISPEYFGIKDVSDLTARTYTIVITESYDYTEYKNEIPIEGTKQITISLANFAQKNCVDQHGAIKVQEIQNRYATLYDGVEYNPKLSPTTVVGYRIVADYSDADIGTAMGVRYFLHVYNPETDEYEKLESKRTATFDQTGSLSYIVYAADYGTTNKYDKDVFRRGNSYYWTFEVDIDSDKDGVVDKVYPQMYDEENTGWYCGSKIVTLNKEKSSFVMYPSYVSGKSAKWKYKFTDVDSSLTANNLGSYVNGSNSRSSYPAVSKGLTDWQTVEFTGLTAGQYYQIKKEEKLNSKASITTPVVASGFSYVVSTSLNLSYSLELTDNYLIVKIDNYESKLAEIEKMGINKVTIEPTDPAKKASLGTKTIDNVRFTSGQFKINLFDIDQFINTEIKVSVNTTFDTGISGFNLGSNNNKVAIQKSNIDGQISYYANTGDMLNKNTGSVVVYSGAALDATNKLLTVKRYGYPTQYKIPIEIDQTGVVYEENNLILKEIREQELASTNNKIIFTKIQPGISVMNNGRRSIDAGLQNAYVTAKINVAGQDIKDDANGSSCQDCIYVEIWQTDSNGGNAEELSMSPIHAPLNLFNTIYRIEGLSPATNYYLKFYTFMKNESGAYVKKYLYDIDDPDADQTDGYKYPFKTTSAVEVSNVDMIFTADTYENKNLELTYQLSSITEYDGIEYELQVWNGKEFVESGIEIPSTQRKYLNYTMNVTIPAPPKIYPNVKWGKQYRIKIKPYGNYNENGQVVKKYLLPDGAENGYDFTLEQFITPSIIISTPEKPESSIYFIVSPNDLSHIIVDDSYKITVKDENGRKIYEETDVKTIDANGYSQIRQIRLDGEEYNLVEGQTYTIEVVAKYDVNNDGDTKKFQTRTIKKTIKYGEGVVIGEITARQVQTDADSFGIALVFTQTYDLTTINSVSYSIIEDITSTYIISETSKFQVSANGNIYTYQINVPSEKVDLFNPGSVYIVSLNFYIIDPDTLENRLVGQDDVRFVYGG